MSNFVGVCQEFTLPVEFKLILQSGEQSTECIRKTLTVTGFIKVAGKMHK